METNDRAKDPAAQQSDSDGGNSLSNSRRRQQRGLLRRFLYGFWREMLAVVLLAAGIFLLTEKLKIRTTLYRLLIDAWAACKTASHTMAGFLIDIEKSDIVGIVLVMLAVWIVGFDIRARMLRRYPNLANDSRCPKCGKRLQRVRSMWHHRLLGIIFRVRVRYYTCQACESRYSIWRTNEDGDW